MKRIKRRIVAIALMLAVCTQCAPVYASDQIALISENVNVVNTTLSIEDGVATCTAYVRGRRGTSSISGAMLLKKGSTVICNWKVATLTNVLNKIKTANVSKGTYTYTLNVNVFYGGVPETVNVSKTVTYK